MSETNAEKIILL